MIAAALLLAGLAPPFAAVDDESVGACARGRAALASCRVQAAARDLVPDPTAGDTDVQHYDLEIEVRPASGWLGGRNTIRVRAVKDAVTAFRLRLSGLFRISELRADGAPATWRRLDDTTVEVGLPRPVASGAEFVLEVAYDGYPAAGGFGGITFASRGGAPLVWTLSEPWYAYTWWPAKDDNTDKATATLAITVPTGMSVAANGVAAPPEPAGGGRTRFRWSTRYPTAPYLLCFSATDYRAFGATWWHGGVPTPVEFFIFPEHDTPSNRDRWLESLSMLDAFSALFGAYPFAEEKYGIYEFGFPGGMEHQTMTGQGRFEEAITAHELSHQWWGDLVTCATWHDVWLNEGFATYSEALWLERQAGGDGARALARAMAARRPQRVDGSVYVDDVGSESRIFSKDFSYLKAGWVLHMLRHVLGDERFFATLAAYRDLYAYAAASTEDFRTVAETSYGSSLAWFFDPWVYGIGAPSYRFGWRETTAGGTDWVELYVAQTQDAGWPTFAMPIDVRVTSGDRDASYVIRDVARMQHFLLPAAGRVDAVALDPGGWVLAGAVTETTFAPGPPRIVATDPGPGERVAPALATPVRVVFQEDVVTRAADYSLAGAAVGPIPFAFAYDRGAATTTLTPAHALAPDRYTLTIADTVVDAASAQPLDGEVRTADDPGALPSGDGQPGGAAVIRFDVGRAPRRHLPRLSR